MITTDSPAISTKYATPCCTSYGPRGARAEWHWEPRSWPISTRNRRVPTASQCSTCFDRRPAGPRTPVLCPQSFEKQIRFSHRQNPRGWSNYERRVSSSVFRHSPISRPSTLRPGKDKGTSTQPPEFDSGRIAVGASWKYVAVKKETFAYECSFHPNMQGKLIVA